MDGYSIVETVRTAIMVGTPLVTAALLFLGVTFSKELLNNNVKLSK